GRETSVIGYRSCKNRVLLRSWSLLVRLGIADHDLVDGGGIDRPVLLSGRRVDDLVGNVHPLRDLPEDAVLIVERRSVGHHDEELRRRAVVRRGTRHRHDAALVLDGIELGLDVLAGAAGAPGRWRAGDGVRIASLNHEAWDDAVKLRAVVETLLGQVDEVLH